MTVLLADIGGTKTQLALMDDSYGPASGQLFEKQLVTNRDFSNFDEVLYTFLHNQPAPDYAVLAIAGPVDRGKRCQMTNLNWKIDCQELQQRFRLKHAFLLNDLQATSWGMTSPDVQQRLLMLRGSSLDFSQPVLVISPGTGLGECCIFPNENGYIINASEGGHKSIAPFNLQSAQLLHQHWQQHGYPPSWENWFSGSGLKNLYGTLHPEAASEPVTIPDNETIGKNALADPDSPSGQCMRFFTDAIYAEAGNLVLQYLAWGGVILAGGIPPKLKDLFSNQDSIQYIERKNEYIDRLRAVPVALCEETDIPLLGTAAFCQQNVIRFS